MEKSFLLRTALGALLVCALLAPLVHLFIFVPVVQFRLDDDLVPMLARSVWQASISTVVTLLLGLIGALGLSRWTDRNPYRQSLALTIALLVPGVLPPLMLVLTVSSATGTLATGLWGVVFFHVLMNVGLTSLLLHQALEDQVEPYWQQAQLMGCSGFRMAYRVFWPLLQRTLLNLSLYFFVLFFLSFSIPLLVGGGAFSGPEAYVFSRVVEQGSWGESLLLCLGLFAFLILATPLLRGTRGLQGQVREFRAHRSPWWTMALILPLLPTGLVLIGFLKVLPSMTQLGDLSLWKGGQMSFLIGLGTGLLAFFSLSLISFVYLQGWLRQFLLGWMNPGWVLVGFSFLLLGGGGDHWSLLSLMLALWVVYLPFLYRLALVDQLAQLKDQVQVALSFPVSWSQIFLAVIWPQALPTICLLSGITALWAAGDFAMSEMLLGAPHLETLALKIKGALETYQIQKAQLQMLPLLFIGLILFLLFQGMAWLTKRRPGI